MKKRPNLLVKLSCWRHEFQIRDPATSFVHLCPDHKDAGDNGGLSPQGKLGQPSRRHFQEAGSQHSQESPSQGRHLAPVSIRHFVPINERNFCLSSF